MSGSKDTKAETRLIARCSRFAEPHTLQLSVKSILLETSAIILSCLFHYRDGRREQWTKAFHESWVGVNTITQSREWQCGGHRDLHGSHDFARAHAKGGKAKNMIALHLDQGLQESSRFRKRGGAHPPPWESLNRR